MATMGSVPSARSQAVTGALVPPPTYEKDGCLAEASCSVQGP